MPSRSPRPPLLLYAAPYRYRQRNAIAASLAWMAEATGHAFETYYDALRFGRHYGFGDADDTGLWGQRTHGFGLQTGGLVVGGRHQEAAALALQRFETTVVCSGSVAFANLFAALAEASGAKVCAFDEDDVGCLYEVMLSHLGLPWPEVAVMVNSSPSLALTGVDAYMYPEILYSRALGIESTISSPALDSLLRRGTHRIRTAAVPVEQQASLRRRGFEVDDLELVNAESDDFATVTHRLALRWKDQRRGWLLGDPVLVSAWLALACREHRTAIFGVPQSRIIELLKQELAAEVLPEILGRQFDDTDFFSLSRLGQSFQVVDPCRPPLPVLHTLSTRWAPTDLDPRASDPSDAELRDHARNGRVLVSVVFWTGMLREVENLYALIDLVAFTGLKAGLVLTAQSLRHRPSPLDLLTVPRDQGGVFPHLEVLLGSCGTGVAVESLLSPHQLGVHLQSARAELRRLALPPTLWPEGWWATMDSPMVAVPRSKAAKPVRITSSRPYLQVRFHRSRRPAMPADGSAGGAVDGSAEPQPSLNQIASRTLTRLRRRGGTLVRGSALEKFFEAYRPYEDFEPGPLLPELAETVKGAGFGYMLSKSGFGAAPHVLYRDDKFVALNYTAGRWDGWTPFETINDASDLRRAERRLLARRQPGWLLGTLDACLWAFSGELWQAAPRLAAIADFVVSGGASGRLVNVAPRVIARYARIIDRMGHP